MKVLGHIRSLFKLPLILCMAVSAYCGQDLGVLEITASEPPARISNFTRHRSIITADVISMSPAVSVPELLDAVSCIDVQQRGAYGIRSDINIRGATFEQALVLIDGIRVNNAQTGHHNMDIPLAVYDIESIEVIHGPGSSVYGSDALGGVVNIVTKKDSAERIYAKLKVAEHNTRAGALSVSKRTARSYHRFSLEKKDSDGYMYDTDFDQVNMSISSSLMHDAGKLDLLAGMSSKEFGAYDFYTPGMGYPSREWIDNYMTAVSETMEFSNIIFMPRISFRKNKDIFVLDQENPGSYRNEHTTYFSSAEMQARFVLNNGSSLFTGLEASGDRIESAQLGDHDRSRYALFAGYETPASGRINLNPGIRIDFQEGKENVSPSMGLAYPLSHASRLRVSAGSSFRSPTFTELYYSGPLNSGNRDLVPEKTLTLETGMDLSVKKIFYSSFTLYYRFQRDLIDWIGATSKGPWRAENIGRMNMYGVDTSFTWRFTGITTSAGYSYVGKEGEKDYISKYALRYASHKLNLRFIINILRMTELAANLGYKKRVGEEPYAVADARISKKTANMVFFLECTNIFDKSYYDVQGVIQSGRWLGCGIGYEM